MRLSLYPRMLLALGLGVVTPALAQRNEVSVDASLLRVTGGYARHVAPRALIGLELGVGFPLTNRTLTPAGDQPGFPDFGELLHLGAFVRYARSDRLEVDTGLRVSAADLWACPASDCWANPFAGGYVQPMYGWKRVKLGGHLIAGWIGESRENSAGSTFLVAINPLIVRVTFPF